MLTSSLFPWAFAQRGKNMATAPENPATQSRTGFFVGKKIWYSERVVIAVEGIAQSKWRVFLLGKSKDRVYPKLYGELLDKI